MEPEPPASRVSADAPLIGCARVWSRARRAQGAGPVDLELRRRGSRRAARPERRGQDDPALVCRRGSAEARARAPAARRGDRRRAAAPGALLAGSRRARTSSCSPASTASPSPTRTAERCSAVDRSEMRRPAASSALGRQPQRAERRHRPARRAARRAPGRADGVARPRQRLVLWRMLQGVSERGGAVAFATQNVEEARLVRRPRGRAPGRGLCFHGRRRSVLRRGGRRRRARQVRARVRGVPRARAESPREAGSGCCCARTCGCSRARGRCSRCWCSIRSCSRCSSAASSAARARGPRVAWSTRTTSRTSCAFGERFDFGRIVRRGRTAVELVG